MSQWLGSVNQSEVFSVLQVAQNSLLSLLSFLCRRIVESTALVDRETAIQSRQQQVLQLAIDLPELAVRTEVQRFRLHKSNLGHARRRLDRMTVVEASSEQNLPSVCFLRNKNRVWIRSNHLHPQKLHGLLPQNSQVLDRKALGKTILKNLQRNCVGSCVAVINMGDNQRKRLSSQEQRRLSDHRFETFACHETGKLL